METAYKTVAFEVDQKIRPKLSILIASYQSGEKLYKTLESVYSQKYDSLEVIICDDGSDDFDERHLIRLEKKYPTKLLRHLSNVGTVRNLNDGLLLCNGEWIMLLAADDALVNDNTVADVMKRAENSNSQWLIGTALLCNMDLHPIGRIVPIEEQRCLLRTGDVPEIWGQLCKSCFLPSCGTIYHRELLQRLGGFDLRYQLVEDWPIFLKLVRFDILPELIETPITLHRANGVSQKEAGRNLRYQTDLIEIMRKEILPYLDLLPAETRRAIETLCQDKEAFFQLRFESITWKEKIHWIFAHKDAIIRKIIQRGRKQYCVEKL